MATSEQATNTVSTKGQSNIPPKASLQALRREARMAFAKTRPDEVFGMLAYDGAPKSHADMEAGIIEEARRRHGQPHC